MKNQQGSYFGRCYYVILLSVEYMRESKESGNPDIPMPEDLKQGFSLFGNHVLLTFNIDFL